MDTTIKHDIRKAPQTGSWKYMKPEVDEKKCIGCGTCVKFCPEACINLDTRNSQHKTRNEDDKNVELRVTSYACIDYEWCKGCGVCAEVCPVKAILMKKN